MKKNCLKGHPALSWAPPLRNSGHLARELANSWTCREGKIGQRVVCLERGREEGRSLKLENR